MAEYNRYSVYKNTPQTWYLDQYNPIIIPAADDDIDYVIPQKYHQQPWMLSKEVYNTERLYYIFAITNMNILKDPVYDFKTGTTIVIPSYERIQRLLGGN